MSELVNKRKGGFYNKKEDYAYQYSAIELKNFNYFSTMMVFYHISILIYLADIDVRRSLFKAKKKPTEAQQ